MAVAQLKLPPNSLEAEQSVLGGLMLDNRRWHDIADKLADADFYREDHQAIFRAIAELIGANKPCDFVTLSEFLRHQGRLEEAGGLAYLSTLANDTPSAANVLAYAEIVRERSVLRKLIAAGTDITEMGFRPEGRSPSELVDQAEQKVFGIREQSARGSGEIVPIAQLMPLVEERIELLRKDPSKLAGLSTGILDLDKKTQGLHPGDLIIVAGRPSMGKTSFAMNIAEHAAIDNKIGTAVFSMEMSAEQLALRVLSSFGRIDQTRLRSGQLDDRDWASLVSAGALIREAPLYIDESSALSPLDLRARARRLKQRHNIGLIVVDYIQLMQVPGNTDNRANEIAMISRNLKALAKELKLPVIALSQLNRKLEDRNDKRPHMADLRESGGIEQDADVIMFIYRDEVYNKDTKDKGKAEIIIGKQRNGPIGTVETVFLSQFTKFADKAKEYGY